jgi:DNA-binding NarL/FixJ family response regulator
VLIVEDNTGVRALVRVLIGDSAGEIYECGDGITALDLYAAVRPEWVLMDISMPGIDGIETTRRLTSGFPGARVVMLTDHGDDAYRRAAAAAGACGFVLKEEIASLPAVLGLDSP